MIKQDNRTSNDVTPLNLSNLDKEQLLELLLHKTQLFVTARTTGIKDPAYTNSLKEEVEMIQAEVNAREEGVK